MQNALQSLIKKSKIKIEEIVRKTSHSPAILYQVKERGFIREGYYADLVLIDLNKRSFVKDNPIYYKCQWNAFENEEFNSVIVKTFVNGYLKYDIESENIFDLKGTVKALEFER